MMTTFTDQWVRKKKNQQTMECDQCLVGRMGACRRGPSPHRECFSEEVMLVLLLASRLQISSYINQAHGTAKIIIRESTAELRSYNIV